MRKYIAPVSLALVGFVFGGPIGAAVLVIIWAVFATMHTSSPSKKK